MNTKEIAQTILSQLGGNKFCVMTGAKDLVCHKDKEGNPYLGFKFKMCRKANYCQIALTPSDTYDMTFVKLQKYDFKEVKKFSGVCCDMLCDIFEDFTGLRTSLTR